MVEISCKLLGGRSVFIAGETVECDITFKISESYVSNRSKSPLVKLAWASAQIHCQCSVNESKIALGDKSHKNSESSSNLNRVGSHETSLAPFKDEKGSTVFSSKPAILFCDITLGPGDSQTFRYKETLPVNIAPSYRGSCLKYSYKITIGTQKIGGHIKLMKIPIRVLIIPGLEGMMNLCEGSDDCRPTNPFYQPIPNDNSIFDVAMENLQLLTCRKIPSHYNITNKKGLVVEFCLFKHAFRLGDDIIGVCIFDKAAVKCVQFSVTLQCKETLLDGCHLKSTNRKASSSSLSTADLDGSIVTNVNKHEEFILFVQRTHIAIPIPLTATPAFSTDLVALKWRLHFEFVTLTSPLLEHPSESNPVHPPKTTWTAPANLDVETMVWDLPIKIYATNPAFINKVSMLNSESVCTL
ncbi:hypothetical protein HELRODRAFT_186248 [Helobdella robusta]|uniref:Uncharacterized protein n=1 Tax=Helobdella robusta TaxID=6412 RepID=T1FNV1_HELRO|nr:hypothetical protein HELRODRAFT_186248 [Helobdella robusta]ESN89822.1 hypothetical protein HELRODRAFT_186248 [Helobdella robusta]